MVLEFSGASESSLLMVGTGRAVITPPAGYPICGPEHPERASTAVRDDLLAKVLVIESSGDRSAVVALDAWGLSEDVERQIIEGVARSARIPAEHVWICVSGNGTSPCLWEGHAAYPRYSAYLPDIVAGAAVMAGQSMEPASISVGAARLPEVSTSVEGPGRPGDEALFTVAFDGASGEGLGRIVNFSCPATISGPDEAWTADYPGYATWAMEQGGGGLSLFAQGASADIRPFDWHDGNSHPSHWQRNAADVQALGLLLATQAAQSTAVAQPRRNAPVAAAADPANGLKVLRMGPAVFVSARAAQPSRFARHIRRDLPASTVIVSANLQGDSFSRTPQLDETLYKRAVGLARETGAR